MLILHLLPVNAVFFKRQRQYSAVNPYSVVVASARNTCLDDPVKYLREFAFNNETK